MDLKKSLKDISKIGIVANIIFLVAILFNNALWISIVILILNIILFGTLIIIEKYYFMFSALSTTNKVFKKLNDGLSSMHG